MHRYIIYSRPIRYYKTKTFSSFGLVGAKDRFSQIHFGVSKIKGIFQYMCISSSRPRMVVGGAQISNSAFSGIFCSNLGSLPGNWSNFTPPMFSKVSGKIILPPVFPVVNGKSHFSPLSSVKMVST